MSREDTRDDPPLPPSPSPSPPAQATTAQLTAVHDAAYVSMVAAAASSMAANPPPSPVPLTPMVQQARDLAET